MSFKMAAPFYDCLAQFGDSVALMAEGGRVTYRSLEERAKHFAERFGPRRQLVFLEASNSVDFISAYLACLAGGHPVYLFSGRELQKTALLTERYRPNIVLHWQNGVLEEARPCAIAHELHPDLSVLLSTSGSTGTPKLVKLSGRNIHSNAEAICTYLKLNSNDRALTALPFNYSYGMSVLNSHLACGASLALTDLSVGEREFWELFRTVGATSFAGVPYSFEMLDRAAFPWAQTPGLRYVTQAGGRLAPELVKKIAALGEKHGWLFYVMYGQTEASPRIAYLPPERAAEFPHCIGIPVPGGEIELIDDAGAPVLEPDVPGELTYRGPNVMMGYAHNLRDLAYDETPERLLTDDIAKRNSEGLFYIVGRRSRFIKPFGIRLNLDEVQSEVRQRFEGSACTGTDDKIVVALLRRNAPAETRGLIADLALQYNLPPFVFEIVVLEELPLLDTGKVDYSRLLAVGAPATQKVPLPADRLLPDWLAILLSPDFYRQACTEAAKIVGFAQAEWESVSQIYATFIGAEQIEGTSTFSSLSGDSLSFVQTHLALETYLGIVPQNWESLTIDELERRAHAMAL